MFFLSSRIPNAVLHPLSKKPTTYCNLHYPITYFILLPIPTQEKNANRGDKNMAKLTTVTFTGTSGATYGFEVYPWDTGFNAVGAIYLVTKRSRNSGGRFSHTRIYVGQTSDLSERFDNHHQASCFSGHGVNCICVYREDSERQRLQIEADLISNYRPPCNG